MVEVKLLLPAPMVWEIGQVAEERFGIETKPFMIMAIARAMRKPRGPQVDLSKDWDIYRLWLQRLSTVEIAEKTGVARKTVATRLEAMGLKSHFLDQTRLSLRSKKGWEARRLKEQQKVAEEQAAEQTNGEADRKAAEAAEKRARRARQEEAA